MESCFSFVASLAVHTLMAYHGLKATPGTESTTAALDALASANLPIEAKRLLEEGRRLLTVETMFGSERELHEFSETKYARLRRMPGQFSAHSMSERVAAELSAVEVISVAYRRAQTIVTAFEEAHAAETKRKATAAGFGRCAPDPASRPRTPSGGVRPEWLEP